VGVGRGERWAPYWILKTLAKKGCFHIIEWKKQISSLLATPSITFGRIPKNSQCPPTWKKTFRRPWTDVYVINVFFVEVIFVDLWFKRNICQQGWQILKMWFWFISRTSNRRLLQWLTFCSCILFTKNMYC